MADPPNSSDEDRETAEDRFLIALWELLERALELSTATDAMDHIDEVSRCCEAAARLCRTGPDRA
jgi:hypothetical protein